MDIGGKSADTYQISKVSSGLKEYYVSITGFQGRFGTGDVLSPTGSGTDRFYVMALSDVDRNTYSFSQANKLAYGQWHIPSRNEWLAFGGRLGIRSSNFTDYGLSDFYWASNTNPYYYVNNNFGWMVSTSVGAMCYVRLGTTF